MDFGSILSGGVSQFLKGLDFPKSKQEIIEYAEEHNAPDQVIKVLDKVPDKVYQKAEDLEKEVAQKK